MSGFGIHIASQRQKSNISRASEITELTPLTISGVTASVMTTNDEKSSDFDLKDHIQVNILLNSICAGWLRISQPQKITLCEFRRLVKRDIGKLGHYHFLCRGAPCSAAQEAIISISYIWTEPQDDLFASHGDIKIKIVRLMQRTSPSRPGEYASSDEDNSGVAMGLAIMGFNERSVENINLRSQRFPVERSSAYCHQTMLPDAVSLVGVESSLMKFVVPPVNKGMSMIIIVAMKKHVFTIAKLSAFLLETPISYDREHPVWVDIEGGPEIFQSCQTLFPPIHPLTLEDVVMNDTREKIEWFDTYMLLILRIPDVKNPEQTEKVSILVFSNSLVVTHHNTVCESLSNMRKKIQRRHTVDKDVTYSCPDPAWVVYGIFDGIVDNLIPLVSKIGKQVGDIEKDVLTKSEPDDQSLLLQKIQKTRAFLTDLRQVLLPKYSIASNIMSNVVSVEWMSAVPLPWWTDCQDHIARMKDQLRVGNSDLESLQNVFLAKVSLNITMKSHHLNELASKLGTLATVLLPLTFITGLFGMNVKVPWDRENSLLPFFGLCIFMLLLVSVQMAVFRLKRWL